MEPVGVARRAVAVLVDSILLFVVGYAIAAMAGGTTQEGFHLQGLPFFLWLVISLGYYIVMEATLGATLGKLAMRLKVVKEDGAPLDWQAAIVRNVLRLVDALFFYLVAAISVWVSKSRQRLGDKAAHTLVVSARVWACLALAAFLAVGSARESLAAPQVIDPVISDSRDGPARKVFKPNTAKIHVRAALSDISPGTRLKSEWIAVKTEVAPANHKIDSHEMKAGPGAKTAHFSFSKPTAGWPEGDYRVDLFVDGKPAGSVPFRVAK
jgi:uncharacterized RDD family membrane protein YckC